MPYAHVFSALASHIESIITNGGYFVLWLFTALEGIPLIGMLVPGHITIILSGFLARIGTLNIYWVITVAVSGAIIGDYIGFYFGRRFGLAFIDRLRPYFFITDAHIEKAQDLLKRHTGKAMIIGRFTPATRALMPFLVGASETHIKKFWIFNIIGAVSWVVSSVMLGYLFGAGYHAVAGYMGRAVIIAIVFGVITIWGYRFVNKRFHVFRKYELITLAMNVLSIYLLARTVQGAFSTQSLTTVINSCGGAFSAQFDVCLNLFMANNVTPFMANIASIVSYIGGMFVTTSFGVVVGFVLLFRKKWRSAAIMLLSIATTAVSVGLLKEFFMRARPDNALQIIVNDPSFPSGHSAFAAAFFVAFAYIFAPKIDSWVKRELFLSFCIISAVLIGISRLVLNVHWASDVIAGWSLGIFMSTATILLVRYISILLIRKKVRYNDSEIV